MGMQEEWEWKERLTDSGQPKEIDDEPRTLPLDKVVETRLFLARLDERAQKRLAICRENEVREGVFVPLDGEDFGRVESNWKGVST
jgi:hypothetical protein